MTLQENTFTKTLHVNTYNEFQSIKNTINTKNIYSQSITSRDLNGKIRSSVEHINGKTIRKNYSYDSNGRLIEAKSRSGNIILIPFDGLVIPILKDKQTHKETYSYDSEGNRVQHTTTINKTTTTQTATFYHNALEQINNTYYTYNTDGYLNSKSDDEGTTLYMYGIYGELISVITPQDTIEYIHNANNQRVAKKVDGIITEKYLWLNLTTLLAIYDANDNLITRYDYANERVPYKMIQDNQTYYLSYNHLGSLRTISNETGIIVKEIKYSAYGEILEDTNQSLHVNIGFAGGLYDKDTKLTRFGYRDYDAQTGKWTAKDPIGFSGGDSNLYGYVLNNPVNFIDPEGLYYYPQPVFYKPIKQNDINNWNASIGSFGYYKPSLPKGPFGGLCGEEGTKTATWIPDISPDACKTHDKCYSDCSKAQRQCDLELFHSNPYYGIAVIFSGKVAYDSAQRKAKGK